METDEQNLIIYNSDGEILAKHPLCFEKGKLIQDRQHTRNRTKGIDAFMDTVVSHFDDRTQAAYFITEIKEKHPRYIRDQLHLLLKVMKTNPTSVINLALRECVKRQLFSATDFSDVIQYLKRQRSIPDTISDHDDQKKQPITMTSSWIMETNAQRREMNSYYAILEGDPNE